MPKHWQFKGSSLGSIFALFLLPCIAFAQITNVTDDQSTPIPAAGHNYLGLAGETVNPANGSVSFRLSADVPKGRGITIPFTFAYDSSGAFHIESAGYGRALWSSNQGFGWIWAGGWSLTVPMLSWTYQTVTQGDWSCDYVSDFVFQDPSGGRHFLGMAALIDTWGQCGEVSGINTALTGGDDLYYSVGSNSDASTVLVTDDVAGTAYSFSVIPAQQYTVASFVEDRNGNKITINSNYGNPPITVTDTLNRQLTISSGSPQSVQVPGLANPYTVSWAAGGSSYPSVGQTADSQNSMHAPFCAPNPIPAFGWGSSIQARVAETITLPNLGQYVFSYNQTYGLISEIAYPGGAWIKYSWGMNYRAEHVWLTDSNNIPDQCGYTYDSPALVERQVSFDGVNLALDQRFSYTTNWSASGYVGYKSTQVTTTDYTQTPPKVTVTQYSYNAVSAVAGPNDNTGFVGEIPVESTVTYMDSSNHVYRMEYKSWSDQYMMTCESTTQDGQTSRTDYNPGAVWPWSDKMEWDYNQMGACPTSNNYTLPTNTPLRETKFTTQAFNVQVYPSSLWQFPLQNPMFVLPTSVTINYQGTQAAQTTYIYDSGGASARGEQYVGRDSNFNEGGIDSAPRGNIVSKTKWLNTGGSPITSFSYNDNGQMISMTDPCGNTNCADMTGQGSNHTTTYSYADVDYHAYLSQVNYPVTANGAPHSLSFTYNLQDGQLATSVDQNLQTTSYYYGQNGELLDRLTSISYPDGGLTKYSYAGACPQPTQTQILLSGSIYYTETATMDGLCHLIQKAITSDTQSDYIDTTYTGQGQVYTVSNPYRNKTTDTSYGVTTTNYDPLGRVVSVVYPDGSTTGTVYLAGTNEDCSQVTDPALVSRTLCSDALGRLRQVTENGLSATTHYGYDGLDNLVSVSQGTQTRSFSYDSLKWLVSASNPEISNSGGTQCPTSYIYDANGNVSSRTDPLENQSASCSQTVTTAYNYDVLNRLGYKQYSDGTPTANFFYDVAPSSWPAWSGVSFSFADGRMTAACTGSNPGSCSSPQTAVAYSYDKMGRPAYYWQCTSLTNCGNSSIWQTYYHYDAAGDNDWWTHPALFTITQHINGAREADTVTSSLTDQYHPATLASVTYTPFGSVSTLTNGCVGSNCTNIQETYFYNKRLEMAMAELGTSGTHWSDACRVYNYYATAQDVSACSSPQAEQPSSWPTGTDNNGSVAGYYYTDPMDSNSLCHSAVYAYDGVNRLTGATIKNCSSQNLWSQSYSYNGDASNNLYGNMSCTPAGPGCVNFSFSAATNRITTSGYNYDAAGNVIGDGMNTYQWDAEGRLSKVVNGHSVAISTNTYNALGQRVRDQGDGVYNPTTTDELYGAGGDLLWRYTGIANDPNDRRFVPFVGRTLAEYSNGTPATIFDHRDEIGSNTVSTDYTGNSFNEKLFYPFGEFWTGYAIPSFNMQQTFAQLPDYDPETDQYNTANRHYSPMGRWLSPDPVRLTSDRLIDPQQLNLYAYARNNPLEFVDPSGMILRLLGDVESAKQELCRIVGAENCKRISVDDNGVVSFDTEGLDLSSNEGALLIYDLTWEQSDVYGFSAGPTVETAGGTVQVDTILNLDNRHDSRYDNRKPPGSKLATEMPPLGVDDIVAINPNPRGTVVSLTTLKPAEPWTQAFHELAEALNKVSGFMQYHDAHEGARLREDTLRNQRQELQRHNPGSGGPADGPGDNKLIKK